MYVGAAYDLEFGNAYMQYCEGAYTGLGNVWSASYWTNVYAPAGQTVKETNCWADPELLVSLDMLFPSSIASLVGEVQIYEVKLF